MEPDGAAIRRLCMASGRRSTGACALDRQQSRRGLQRLQQCLALPLLVSQWDGEGVAGRAGHRPPRRKGRRLECASVGADHCARAFGQGNGRRVETSWSRGNASCINAMWRRMRLKGGRSGLAMAGSHKPHVMTCLATQASRQNLAPAITLVQWHRVELFPTTHSHECHRIAAPAHAPP